MKCRSKTITLTMLAGTAIILGGCFDEDEKPKLMKDEAECQSQFDDPEGCREAAEKAKKEFDEKAPKFDQQAACEAQFGKAQCHQESRGDGTSFFMPFMAGYFMSGILNNGQRQYAVQPACNQNGSVYGGGCGPVTGARPGYVPVNTMAGRYSGGSFVRSEGYAKSWTTGKVATSRASLGSAAVARGGFGHSAFGSGGE